MNFTWCYIMLLLSNFAGVQVKNIAAIFADSLRQWFWNFRGHQNQNKLETLLKNELDSSLKVSNSLIFGWGLRICISSKFPGGVDAASLEVIIW